MLETMRAQLDEHARAVEAMRDRLDVLARVVGKIVACLRSGGRVYVCGNGGSAADAQHIAAELLGRFKQDRSALPAIALTTDSSTLTALANDLGYERTFARQVEALVTDRDILWALSVSGRSANVLAALRAARDAGAATIGFTGRSGGAMGELCDLCFCAMHDQSDRVQEMHELAYHLVCDHVERRFAAPPDGTPP